ncbi:MAG: hypothetical protein JXR63_08990 [Spirochaetales bacterium]|nr:hypothetical protein [Spirochaetales bacterium]
MLVDIDKHIDEIKSKNAQHKKLRSNFLDLQTQKKQNLRELKELKVELTKEKEDYERIKKFGLEKVFYTIIGQQESKLEKEKQEFIVATMKFDTKKNEIKFINEELIKIRQKIGLLGDIKKEYESFMFVKEYVIKQQKIVESENLNEFTKRENLINNRIRELNEAKDVGEQITTQLNQALSALESAADWGVCDIFGGGFIATSGKYARIDKARNFVAKTQVLMNRYKKELADADIKIEKLINIGELSTFADYLIDGFVFDLFAQYKINKSIKRVQEILDKITKAQNFVEQQLDEEEMKLEHLRVKKNTLIEKVL